MTILNIIPKAALALTLAGCAASAGSGSASAGPLQCEIVAKTSGGMTRLEAVAHAERPTSGQYSFQISSSGASGSSNVRQGGEFEAAPGRSATLGTAGFGAGASYKATLEVNANGERVTCEKRG